MSGHKDTRILGVDELCVLFEAVDRHLVKRASIVVIGGAAAAFHQAESTTNDVDTLDALTDELRAAVDRATFAGLSVPISASTVAQVPDNYDQRLERVLPHLKNLEVWVLERHDLALSKIVRGVEHDMQQLEEIHRHHRLDFEVLVERFRTEMASVVGDPSRIRLNFLELIERLFGELKRVVAQKRLS
ncbi:MAG: hypothetical protein KIT31_31045 [Deltaproteobacteria bacterium]|nr:hypothetical protein [Deltaproteobacteria bacterium]